MKRLLLGLLFLSPFIYAEEFPLGRGSTGWAILVGGQMARVGRGWDAGPNAAVRYYFPIKDADSAGPESLSPWSLEAGLLFPHTVAHQLTETVSSRAGVSSRGFVDQWSGGHLAAQYKWAVRRPLRMTPELSLGVQLARFENQFMGSNIASFYKKKESQTVVGPLARLGLSVFANDWFALRMEAGYVHLPNQAQDHGLPFDFDISGLAIYPSIQVSLGYLTPGVSKGVFLPPESLPMWVLSAMQSEKRSPVVAPPEVYLNATSARQGLSGNVLFQYKNRRAEKVELIADFNQWTPEPMYMDKKHVWMTVKDLPAGTYHYSFLINGKREVRDPWNIAWEPSHRPGGSSTFFIPEVYRHE